MADAMGVYNRIKVLGHDAKAEADSFMQSLTTQYTDDHPAPPEEIQHGLEEILAKHQKNTPNSHAIEHTASMSHDDNSIPRATYVFGLATVLLAIASASTGIPYVPPPIY